MKADGRIAWSWLWVLALAGLLTGCGQDEATTGGQQEAPAVEAPPVAVDDETAVGNVVTTYLNALAARDYGTACAQLTPQAQEEVLTAAESAGLGGTGSCEEAIAAAFGTLTDQDLADLRDVPITAVQIEGDNATAEIQGGTGPIPLTRSRGGWLISEFPKA